LQCKNNIAMILL